MGNKTRRILQVMIWVFITVLIGTCIWATIKEQDGATSILDQGVEFAIIAACMFLIAAIGIILMLNTPAKSSVEARKDLLSKRH